MTRARRAALLILFAAAPSAALAADGPSLRMAVILSATGLVRVKDSAAGPALPAAVGRKIGVGGQVITLENARCEVRFTDGHFIRMSPLTTVSVTALPKPGAKLTLLHLLKGHLRALIDKSQFEGDFGVYGATTVTAVKGTDYDVDRPSEDDVDVQVNDGKVNVGENDHEDDPAATMQAFSGVLAGLIGMTLLEGNHMFVQRGKPFPKAMAIPHKPGGVGGPGGGHGGQGGGGSGRGGAGGGRHGGPGGGGSSGPGVPHLPGGFGFP